MSAHRIWRAKTISEWNSSTLSVWMKLISARDRASGHTIQFIFDQHKQLSPYIHFECVAGKMSIYCMRACVCLFMCAWMCQKSQFTQITTQSKAIWLQFIVFAISEWMWVNWVQTCLFACVYVHVNTRFIDVRPASNTQYKNKNTDERTWKCLFLPAPNGWNRNYFFAYTNRKRRNSIIALIVKFNKVTHLISFNASFCSSFPLWACVCLPMCGMSVGTMYIHWLRID